MRVQYAYLGIRLTPTWPAAARDHIPVKQFNVRYSAALGLSPWQLLLVISGLVPQHFGALQLSACSAFSESLHVSTVSQLPSDVHRAADALGRLSIAVSRLVFSQKGCPNFESVCFRHLTLATHTRRTHANTNERTNKQTNARAHTDTNKNALSIRLYNGSKRTIGCFWKARWTRWWTWRRKRWPWSWSWSWPQWPRRRGQRQRSPASGGTPK